jgi:hypothetical protein
MRSSGARRLLGCLLAGLIAGVGAQATAGRAAEALSTASPPAGGAEAVTVAGKVQPSRLAIKRHGYYHNVSVHGLQWTNWGTPQATAAGTFTYQFCVEESCSVAPFFDEPVVVTLSAIERCRGRSSYTTLALQVNGSMPDESFKGFRTSVAACPRHRSGGH